MQVDQLYTTVESNHIFYNSMCYSVIIFIVNYTMNINNE